MFNKIPVEFVPPGVTAEEARRQRKRQMGPNRRDMMMGVGSVILLLLLCVVAIWYYIPSAQAEETKATPVKNIEPAQKTTTALAAAPSPSPLAEPTNTPLPEPIARPVSPVAKPLPLLAQITPATPTATAQKIKIASQRDAPTSTPTATATKSPYDYEIIGHEVVPSDLYSYVGGWIVESDGETPRPVRVRLRFATGEMVYPRPNNRDVATGRYEFMTTPGRYWLELDGGPVVQIDIGDSPVRHEVSFRSLSDQRVTAPARSAPWPGGGDDGRVSVPSQRATATPELRHKTFLPLVATERHKYYFSVFYGGDSE